MTTTTSGQYGEDSAPKPSRTTSCQLPIYAQRSHRPTQSFDEFNKMQSNPSLAPRSHCCTFPYDGAKSEKQKPGYNTSCPSWFLSVLLVLTPIVFIAGYGTAIVTEPLRGSNSHLGMMRVSRGGADGRLLSYELSAVPEAATQHGESEEITVGQLSHSSAAPKSLPGHNMMFVTWIAFGDFGDGGFKTHNFHKVDMRWAEVARRSHPGCKIGLVLDQDTQLEQPELVDFLHRLEIDKSVYGRNEYNDFYHWTARYTMLQKLQAEGEDWLNVIFVDPDVFVLDDIKEVFDEGGFDYMTTISENPYQPINGAMHFVRAHRYSAAIDLLKGVLASFQLKPEMGFTAGQQAYSDYFELTGKNELVMQLQESAVSQGVGCHKIREGEGESEFNICYVICTRYNFWEDCTDHPGVKVTADKAEDYAAAQVKVFHFIAYRKLGMQLVYEAFMSDGLEGAYAAWAKLPHTEDGFKADARFGEEA